MPNEVKCPKCETLMAQGIILDRGHMNAKGEQTWLEGQADSTFWSNGISTTDKATYKIITFRCSACGFLESYTSERIYI